MFDKDRLFKILLTLSNDLNYFLIAQDSFSILRSCLQQLNEINIILNNYQNELNYFKKEYIRRKKKKEKIKENKRKQKEEEELEELEEIQEEEEEELELKQLELELEEELKQQQQLQLQQQQQQQRDNNIPLSYQYKNEMKKKIKQLSLIVNNLNEMYNNLNQYENILTPLLHEAESFWFCSPVDHTHCISENKIAVEKWRNYRNENLSELIITKIKNFQNNCKHVLETYFSDLLTIYNEELQQETKNLQILEQQFYSNSNSPTRLSNQIPLYINQKFELMNHSFIVSLQYPITHFYHIDQKFADLMGYSVSRLLTFPIYTFSINIKETDDLVNQILNAKTNNIVSRIFYRKVTREIIGIQWNVGYYSLNNLYYMRGIDITSEIEISKTKQINNIQRMLKQWLHNIRNASFEQQALVIESEIMDLEKKINAKLQNIHQKIEQNSTIQDINNNNNQNNNDNQNDDDNNNENLMNTNETKLNISIPESTPILESGNSSSELFSNSISINNSDFINTTSSHAMDISPISLTPESSTSSSSSSSISNTNNTTNIPTTTISSSSLSSNQLTTPTSSSSTTTTTTTTTNNNNNTTTTNTTNNTAIVTPYQAQFQNIYDCIKLLIHSTKISVGLITQALNTKGLSQHICIFDFIQSIQATCDNYCHLYSVFNILKIDYKYQLNNNPVTMNELNGLYVVGEITSIQTILDNIISNAIRYSDPSLGIRINITINLNDNKFQFLIEICDSVIGGLPIHIFNLFKENLGLNKCTDERLYPARTTTFSPAAVSNYQFIPNNNSNNNNNNNINNTITSTSMESDILESPRYSYSTLRSPILSYASSYSSSTVPSPSKSLISLPQGSGIAHIITKYHEFTQSGDDFDLHITTTTSGSSFRIRFSLDRMAVPLPTEPSPKNNMSLDNTLNGKVLIVDDSMVIRKILSKYLDGFKCPHQVCIDGSRAWEWFQSNYQNCPGVISDLEMPVMGGEALIENIQTFCPGKPCFIVSGNEIPSDKLPNGVIRALLKPITAEQVLSILHEISKHSNK